MSLSSFLRDRANADVRDWFRAEFVKPSLGEARVLLAPPITQSPMLIGTAFDYLLRFHLKRWNPRAKEREWVAEHACLCSYEVNGEEVSLDPYLWDAKVNYVNFLRDGVVTDKLLVSALALAHLDGSYRMGLAWYPDETLIQRLNKPPESDLQDLRELISIVKPDVFQAKKVCVLNPTFGKASELIGGADCDLVLDDALIEIKTLKTYALERHQFNQLLGYYCLSQIGGIDGAPRNHRINRIGVYFSRHAHLWVVNLDDVVGKEKLPSLVKRFAKRMRR